MTAGFIVRAEHDGHRWKWTLQDLASGERRSFDRYEACCAALRGAAEAHLPPPRHGDRS